MLALLPLFASSAASVWYNAEARLAVLFMHVVLASSLVKLMRGVEDAAVSPCLARQALHTCDAFCRCVTRDRKVVALRLLHERGRSSPELNSAPCALGCCLWSLRKLGTAQQSSLAFFVEAWPLLLDVRSIASV